jgi:hypothetical protein
VKTKRPFAELKLSTLAAALAAHTLVTNPATAGVVFSESFEAPVVTGFVQNTVPSNGKWIGANQGYGATNRGKDVAIRITYNSGSVLYLDLATVILNNDTSTQRMKGRTNEHPS